MIISVSINGVLRDVLSRFEDVYNKYFEEGVKSEVVTPNLIEYTHFKTPEELFEFIYEEHSFPSSTLKTFLITNYNIVFFF